MKEGHRFINTAHSDSGNNSIQGTLPKRMAQKIGKHQYRPDSRVLC